MDGHFHGRPLPCIECPVNRLGASKCELCPKSICQTVSGERILICFDTTCKTFKNVYVGRNK